MAEQLGTTLLTVYRWERGSHYPSAYFRVKLCALFGKSMEELGFVAPSEAGPHTMEGEVGVAVETPPSRSHFPNLWSVPASRNPFFLGREEINPLG